MKKNACTNLGSEFLKMGPEKKGKKKLGLWTVTNAGMLWR